MTTWAISTISADCQHPTSNSAGVTSHGRTTIWDTTNPAKYVDGTTGSTVPVTLDIPFEPGPNWTTPIEVVGTYVFPPVVQGKKYFVTGWVLTNPLAPTQVLQSGLYPVPVLNAPNNINAQGFTVGVNGVPFLSSMPFRWGGDFTWRISIEGTPAAAGIPTAVPTRLELCWARADASSGPSTVPDQNQRTQVNFGGVYPIGLLRYFVPDPSEFVNIPNVANIQVFGRWYVNRSMQIIWNWPQLGGGPKYDNIQGEAKYGVEWLGGDFDLGKWLGRVHPLCNCFDLAAITQMATAILVDQNGLEILNSNWVCQEPNGYINSGPLYGRLTESTCNNPFWASNGTTPHVQWDDKNRTHFGLHAWVEVSYEDTRRFVLDATHATNPAPIPLHYVPGPEIGTLSRKVYLAYTLDNHAGIPVRGNSGNNDASGAGGDCYQNPDYRLDRIGVVGVDLTTLPIMATRPQLPIRLSNELEALLEQGKNPQQPDPSLNAAPLHPEALIQLLSPGDIGMAHDRTLASIKPNHTDLTLKFMSTARTGSPSTSTISTTARPDTALMLELRVFDSPEHAIARLTTHMLGFQARPLNSVIKPSTRALGAFSFRSLSSIFWVRGDVFASLTHWTSENKPSGGNILMTLASRLDHHLAGNTFPIDHIEPEIVMEVPPPPVIKPGEKFCIKVSCSEGLLEERVAISDNVYAVLPGGPGTGDGEFTFFARNPGEAKVTIRVANSVTLRPASLTFVACVTE